ncbi:SecDF P1 head subdomain-containing protein [Caproiciproducens sp. MSJ-32]|uniref:SecDF P1 head subdomain-containing protein n=1 Tax=Caproiciproducens sp. MSJ-32 TaxID=2841527 RepID=UPI001C107718|nr:hypothetical protein [Caproiciproducens sp. MSJ-32]MBU5454321.1 hypothetical protein [Caproiciproducens sp. MSJ-32]
MKGKGNKKGSVLITIITLFVLLLSYLGFHGAIIGPYEIKSFDKVITKGLDLGGGSSTLLIIEKDKEDISEEVLKKNLEVIEKRLKQMDIDNSYTAIEDEKGIRVNIRNNVNIDSVIDRLTHNGKVEIKDEEDKVIFTQDDIKEADYIVEGYSIKINLIFTEETKLTFSDFTENNIDKSIKIYLDDDLISTETIDEAITDGKLEITGVYDLSEAEEFVDLINSGAIIGNITAEDTETVGPSLGENAYSNIVKGIIIGIIVIFILTIAYYKIPGLFGSLSVLLSITLTLIAYTEIDLAFTVNSLLALIFSILIALLSNIIILEKVSREIPLSKNLKSAVADGTEKGNSIVFKINIIIFIIAVILYYLLPLSIKSPAVIILMASIVNIISSIVITKLFLKSSVNSILKSNKQFRIKKNVNKV